MNSNKLTENDAMTKNSYARADGLDQNTIDISVIVPFHNAEKHIEQCITALLSQSFPSSFYEIIMVDNNSTDNSIKVIMKYPQIKLLSEKKQGSYAARNRGVAESKGSVIAFTDSDCIPVPEWLGRNLSSPRLPRGGIISRRPFLYHGIYGALAARSL